MAKPIMSLEQFAALEAWLEAAAQLAGLKMCNPRANHATVVTDMYQKRMRAMSLLTGAKPPPNYVPPEDDASDLA